MAPGGRDAASVVSQQNIKAWVWKSLANALPRLCKAVAAMKEGSAILPEDDSQLIRNEVQVIAKVDAKMPYPRDGSCQDSEFVRITWHDLLKERVVLK